MFACSHQSSLNFKHQLSKEDRKWISEPDQWPLEERVYVESFKIKDRQPEVENLISLKKLYNNSIDLHESYLCYPDFYFNDFILPELKRITGKNLDLFFEGAKDLKEKNLLSFGEICKIHLGKRRGELNKTTFFERLIDDDSRDDLIKNKFPKKCKKPTDCFSGLCYEFKNKNEFNKVFSNQAYSKQKTCLPLGFRFFPKTAGVCEIKIDSIKTIAIEGTVKSECLRANHQLNAKLKEWMSYKSECKKISYPLKVRWVKGSEQFFQNVKYRLEEQVSSYLSSLCP